MAEIDVKRGHDTSRGTEEQGTRSSRGAQPGGGQRVQGERPGGLSTRGGSQALARQPGWGWPVRSLASPLELWSAGPFELMRRMSDEMDRMFQGFGGNIPGGNWMPAVEVTERQGNVVVRADLPGLGKDDVSVEATDEGLILSGERRQEHEEEEGGTYRSERSYGSFRRVIPLPEDAQLDHAQARFDNGVLEVTVPVPESSSRRRRIPITAAGTTATEQPAGNRSKG